MAGEVGLLEVTELRRIVGTGCWWDQSHCQREQGAAGRSMQDPHGSSQMILASLSARPMGKGSYAGPRKNQAG